METNREDLKQYTVPGEGGTMTCQPARLTWLKEEFRHMTLHGGWSVNDRRLLAEDTRYCRWPGQSTDGKKHADADAGKPAFPFEGASDVRMRTADDIINEQVMILMAALMRMQVGVKGTQSNNDQLAANLNVLLQWVIRNQLGSEWITEWTKLAQFRQGDSPGVGFMQVWWKQEWALQQLTVTAQDVLAKAQQAAQGGQLPMDQLQELLTDPARQEELTELMQALWPDLRAGTASTAAEELQSEGKASFPCPYLKENRLAIRARRLMEDIFIPENTTEMQRARVIWVREWFSASELREKERLEEFKPGFVDEVLKHEGETCWRHYTHYHVNGDYSNRIIERTWDKSRHRGEYEIMTAYFKASNADGVPGIYLVQYHHAVEKPGSDMELVDEKHGQYNFVASLREILTGKLWDTRGIAELSMTEQQSLKLLHDSFMDHAQLSTVPPVKVPASRPKMALVLGPLKLIKENRPGEISFMNPPAYPSTNANVQQAIEARLDRYFGRISAANPPDRVRTYQQSLIEFFLIDVAKVMKMAL